MSKNFLTADSHFNHPNIIGYCERPFYRDGVTESDIQWCRDNNSNWNEIVDVNKHDEELIDKWNSVVSPEDTVWHLGDFVFPNNGRDYKFYTKKLNGKIVLIRGNHDNRLKPEDRSLFHNLHMEAPTNRGFMIEGDKYILHHYPQLSWNAAFHGRIHFFGHVHSGPKKTFWCMPNSYDVGVDNNNFTPILLKEACHKAKNNPFAVDMSRYGQYIKWMNNDEFKDLEI